MSDLGRGRAAVVKELPTDGGGGRNNVILSVSGAEYVTSEAERRAAFLASSTSPPAVSGSALSRVSVVAPETEPSQETDG